MQAHVAKYLWPEVEFNSTWFKGGANDGKNQTFATPGLALHTQAPPSRNKKQAGVLCGSRRTNRYKQISQLQP